MILNLGYVEAIVIINYYYCNYIVWNKWLINNYVAMGFILYLIIIMT